MRVYSITYLEPDDETEGTAEEAQLTLENGSLGVDDLDSLAKDNDSGITVRYAVYDQFKGEER